MFFALIWYQQFPMLLHDFSSVFKYYFQIFNWLTLTKMEIDLVHYYFREKLYHEMLRSTELSQESDPSDLTSNLYIGVAHFLNGRLSEALDQLQPLTSEPNIALAALLASIHIHKQCKVILRKHMLVFSDRFRYPATVILLSKSFQKFGIIW